jgi:hypothetical protein
VPQHHGLWILHAVPHICLPSLQKECQLFIWILILETISHNQFLVQLLLTVVTSLSAILKLKL